MLFYTREGQIKDRVRSTLRIGRIITPSTIAITRLECIARSTISSLP
jgi:hypothetical protein